MSRRNCPYLKVDISSSMHYCEKLQEVIPQIEYCNDKAVEKYSSNDKPKRKRKTKRERDLKHKNKLIRKSKLYHGVYYRDEKYISGKGFISIEKPYYRRFYRGNHNGNRYRYYKKYANHCVRNYDGVIPDGSGYKKVFDYWWTVD